MMDIHTHILPGVDDGVENFEEALLVLKYQLEQGVNSVVLTPHVHNSAQKVSSSEYEARFNEFKAYVSKHLPNMSLYLGYEVKYSPFKHTDYEKLTFKGFKYSYILIEFSTRNKEPIMDVVYNLIAKGLVPIIAHIERYPYLTVDEIIRMKQDGALIQVNAGAILGIDGKDYKKRALKYIKLDLVDMIASDCHNLDTRKPNLKEALMKVQKNFQQKRLEAQNV